MKNILNQLKTQNQDFNNSAANNVTVKEKQPIKTGIYRATIKTQFTMFYKNGTVNSSRAKITFKLSDLKGNSVGTAMRYRSSKYDTDEVFFWTDPKTNSMTYSNKTGVSDAIQKMAEILSISSNSFISKYDTVLDMICNGTTPEVMNEKGTMSKCEYAVETPVLALVVVNKISEKKNTKQEDGTYKNIVTDRTFTVPVVTKLFVDSAVDGTKFTFAELAKNADIAAEYAKLSADIDPELVIDKSVKVEGKTSPQQPSGNPIPGAPNRPAPSTNIPVPNRPAPQANIPTPTGNVQGGRLNG